MEDFNALSDAEVMAFDPNIDGPDEPVVEDDGSISGDDFPAAQPDAGTTWLGNPKEQLIRFVRVFFATLFSALLPILSKGNLPSDSKAVSSLLFSALSAAFYAGWRALQENSEGKPVRATINSLVGRSRGGNAAARGWGNPGAPGSATSRAYEVKNIVTIVAGGTKFRVHKDVAPIFKDYINQLGKHGYKISDVKDDWGYCSRWVRGRTGVLSNHSWGLAIDINSTKNPMSRTLITDMPVGVVRDLMKNRYEGLMRWGGDYSGRRDSMHTEYIGTPADAAYLIKKLGLK